MAIAPFRQSSWSTVAHGSEAKTCELRSHSEASGGRWLRHVLDQLPAGAQVRLLRCDSRRRTRCAVHAANAAGFNVDPNRLVLIGESAGAELDADTHVAAVVSFYGPSDP